MLDYLAAPDDDGNVPCCDKFDGSMLEDLSQPLDYHKAKEYIEAADIRAMVAADYALGGLQLFIVQMNGEGKRPTLRIFRADEEKTRERIIDDARQSRCSGTVHGHGISKTRVSGVFRIREEILAAGWRKSVHVYLQENTLPRKQDDCR